MREVSGHLPYMQVHVFPTGTRDVDSRSLGALKPGIGRLVSGPETTPLVVPFFHWGMERVKGRGEWLPLTAGATTA